MNPPTARQFEVLATMTAYSARYGRPPTMRELADLLGIRSTNGVSDHLHALQAKGLVRAARGKARSWIVVDAKASSSIDRTADAIAKMLREQSRLLKWNPTSRATFALAASMVSDGRWR